MNLEIDFWDVGQGDCTVLHLPDDRLLIIDVGPPDSMLPIWLDARPDKDIHSLVLTHNDQDHAGCAMDVLKRFPSRIEHFVFVDDRGFGASDATDELLSYGARLHQQGKVKLVRLEVGSGAQPIYGYDGGQNQQVVVAALYPSIDQTTANLHRRKVAKPNEVSGILCLSVNGNPEVVWAGDAPMQVVARVCRNLEPLLVVGPHHGGPVKRELRDFAQSFESPDPANVFVSVGTEGGHDHPVKKFIDLHRMRGRRVCCSELVHCDRGRKLSSNHVLNNHLLLQMLPPKNPNAVTCRGPMKLTWSNIDAEFHFDRFHPIHLKAIEQLRRPYCIPIQGSSLT